MCFVPRRARSIGELWGRGCHVIIRPFIIWIVFESKGVRSENPVNVYYTWGISITTWRARVNPRY